MRIERKTFLQYWVVVGLFALVLGWWLVFFSRLGAVLVERLDAAEAGLTAEQSDAVRRAVAGSTRMLLFEGAFLVLLLLAGVILVLRSMRQQVKLHGQRRDFLSAVTHELKSPIASARLRVESLLLGRVPVEKQEHYLLTAREELDRLGKLVDRLLETARAATGRTELAVERLDLAAFTRDTIERLAGKEEQDVLVEVEAPGDVPVRADVGALETILDNLFSNAIKYGGDPPRIRVRVSNGDGKARLEVRDFGPGRPNGELKRLFDPFVRGGDQLVRDRPGVGLGLFLVAELTRAQGGQVRARHVADGGGFAVEVSLPLAEAEA